MNYGGGRHHMSYIRKSEQVLKNYRKLKYSLKILTRRKQRLIEIGGPSDKVVATLDITGVYGSGSTMPAEKLISELYEIEQSIKATKEEMRIVDDVLRSISRDGEGWYGDLLRDWYINKKSKKELERKYHSSSRNLYYMRNIALSEFATTYYGYPAIKDQGQGKKEGTT